jgi:hypothetical protein
MAANAREFPVGDIGPIQERFVTMSWEIGDVCGEIELKVRYRVNYPSIRHRGLGRDPDVQVLGVYGRDAVDEWRVKSLSPAQWSAVVSMIEVDELPHD